MTRPVVFNPVTNTVRPVPTSMHRVNPLMMVSRTGSPVIPIALVGEAKQGPSGNRPPRLRESTRTQLRHSIRGNAPAAQLNPLYVSGPPGHPFPAFQVEPARAGRLKLTARHPEGTARMKRLIGGKPVVSATVKRKELVGFPPNHIYSAP